VAVIDLKADAKEAGLSWATIRRAKDRLGVVAKRESHGRDGGGRWTWAMPIPARCSSPLQDAHPLKVSTLQKNEHLAAADEVPAHPTAAPDDYPELPACLRRAPPQQTNGHAPALGPPADSLDDLR
jgi:hypothetical protein